MWLPGNLFLARKRWMEFSTAAVIAPLSLKWFMTTG
jgi:hypothetical protein